jgi:hypothetical protein
MMTRLEDIQKFWQCRDSQVLRKLATEFEDHWEYYQQFNGIEERIYAAYEKIVNQKLINGGVE